MKFTVANYTQIVGRSEALQQHQKRKHKMVNYTRIVGGSEALQQHQKRKHKMVTLKHTGKAITKHKP